MKTKIYTFVLFLLFPVFVFSQTIPFLNENHFKTLNFECGGYVTAVYPAYNNTTKIKYDSLGNRKWVSKYYSPYSPFSNAVGVSLKADNKGNCFVTGGVDYAVINGNDMATPVTIKYGPNGDSIWTRLFRLQDTIDFGAGENMVLDDNDNIFIPCNYTIKYDKNGNQLWYANNNQFMSKSVIFENNIYVSGGYYGGPLQITRIIGYNNYNGSQIFNQQYSTYIYPTSLLTFGGALYSAISANDSAILIKYSSNVIHINSNESSIKKFTLNQNFPNPFNSATTIKYSINKNSFIKIQIFDINGREVKTITSEKKTPGDYKVKFEGIGLSSGVYFYSLFADDILIDTKKLILIK